MFLINQDSITALQSQNSNKFSSKETNLDDDLQEPAFPSRVCCSLWNIPCFCCRPSDVASVWERLPKAEKEREAAQASSWWKKCIKAFKKTREWSELVAGPKWKTFIRQFNKTGSKPKKFQYDQLSYALNFDEGPEQNGQLEEDRIYRNFSSRYATAIPAPVKTDKDAPLLK
ncbi:NHL domain-containing protein [Abeliophyllum distichum]|uniref:NHL domain-containing protein n=1 Tax=Abeliophyllum distichum TaxID=126358 RepID=A0ABD1QVG8_9LAMI